MAVGSRGNPNRQRMINLMYLVFIAMMALNVSPEVLDGISQVEGELQQTISTTEQRNRALSQDMEHAYQANPTKVSAWRQRSEELRLRSDSLYHYIQSLKELIAQEADGREGRADALRHLDDLSASSVVMLSPLHPRAKELRKRLEQYRSWVTELLGGSPRSAQITARLATKDGRGGQSWESANFENMPVIAALTLLSHLQSNIRHTEGEGLTELLQSIDAHDYRLSLLTAQVIPDSRIVLSGEPYRARIVLSSTDTTRQPHIVVNGAPLSPTLRGQLSLPTPRTGTFPVEGYVEADRGDGSTERLPFATNYTVIERAATIAPVMMNVLYSGIDNPIKIAVPGIAPQDLTASISSGTLTHRGELWVAHPNQLGEVTISVSARGEGGKTSLITQTKLRVRRLPDPSPYIALTEGGESRFRGGRISKQALLAAGGVRAAIDDSFLDISYTVVRFQLIAFDSMGNAIPEVSSGATFSPRQIRQIQTAPRGKRLYISDIIARGPDGIERKLPSLELIIG